MRKDEADAVRLVYHLPLSDVIHYQLYQYDHAEGSRRRYLLTTWGGVGAAPGAMAAKGAR